MNLADELRLRHRLLELRAGDDTHFFTPAGCWRVSRTPHRFQVSAPDGYRRMCPPVGHSNLGSAFRLRRAVSEILALALGANAVPELKYDNVVRIGHRYAAYYLGDHAAATRLIVYGDTPADARDGYDAWYEAFQEMTWLLKP